MNLIKNRSYIVRLVIAGVREGDKGLELTWDGVKITSMKCPILSPISNQTPFASFKRCEGGYLAP
jgi:hypothetical protein